MSLDHDEQRPDPAREFEAHRGFLWALSYRMTGNAADADDIVQDTFVRALERRPAGGQDGWRAWLARVATNLAIDTLRRRKRHAYVGPWLPSPIETGDEAAPPGYEVISPAESTEHRYDLMESVSIAFLLALERLTPRQRAVLLLRDVFDYTVRETALALSLTQANVKVTHHRARAAMELYDASRVIPTRENQAQTAQKLRAFMTHLQNRDVAAMEAMLAADVRFLSDAGGEFVAAMVPVVGCSRVARLLCALTAQRTFARLDVRMLNGLPAIVAEAPAPPRGAERFVTRIELGHDGKIREIHVVMASAKLSAIRFVA